MENVTFNATFHITQLEDFLRYRIAMKLWLVSMPIFMIIGFLTNSLNILILRRRCFFGNSTSSILVMLSMSDIVNLMIGPLRFIILLTSGKDLTEISNAYCKVYRFFNYFFTDFSVWLVIILALERAFAVGIPHKVRVYFSVRNVYILASAIALFLASINIHFFITYEVTSGSNSTSLLSCTVGNPAYYKFALIIFPWIDFCVFSLVPIGMVTGCNLFIVVKLLMSRYKQNILTQNGSAVTQNQPKLKSMTIIMFMISGFLVIAVVPTAIHAFVYPEWIRKQKEGDIEAEVDLVVFAVYIVIGIYANCCINFFLYSASNKRFRNELVRIIKRQNQVGPASSNT
ncbi:unnamed protein product [Owenia fusiformis]|uniref:Uncharacterized protein n=1 Tax=Owenia fusiformis TaxID=6347 RepID=A0A8J1T8S3_OWEFU|nr:unnamed protein product [Owenia fusiformis]